jgi:high-affinity iron transporter
MILVTRLRRLALACMAAAALLLSLSPLVRADDGAPAALRELNARVEQAVRAAQAGDLRAAAAELAEFHAGWEGIEDAVRDRSPGAYTAIEDAYSASKEAIASGDAAAAAASLETLESANEAFIAGAPGGSPAPPETRQPTVRALVTELDEAREALERGDGTAAQRAIASFRALWPDVEGDVKARSAAVYASTENDAPRVAALIKAGDAPGARRIIERMIDELQPLSEANRYGAFDAAIILLREGLEALLIIAALLAIVKRAGAGGKQGWVWGGAAAGVAASLAVALLLTAAFRGASTGANRELIEGITALAAAAMLFYVSYWLHSKSHLGAWQAYLRQKTSAALATGSLFSLAALAFMAVFREGAETALFYIGIASSIALTDLLLGITAALAALAVIGVLMLWIGVRIPLRPFFLASSALVFYLGFKFIGTGIHALQVAGAIPASPTPFALSVDLLGLFPTWETVIPQVLLLALAGMVIWYSYRAHKRKTALAAPPSLPQ